MNYSMEDLPLNRIEKLLIQKTSEITKIIKAVAHEKRLLILYYLLKEPQDFAFLQSKIDSSKTFLLFCVLINADKFS